MTAACGWFAFVGALGWKEPMISGYDELTVGYPPIDATNNAHSTRT